MNFILLTFPRGGKKLFDSTLAVALFLEVSVPRIYLALKRGKRMVGNKKMLFQKILFSSDSSKSFFWRDFVF